MDAMCVRVCVCGRVCMDAMCVCTYLCVSGCVCVRLGMSGYICTHMSYVVWVSVRLCGCVVVCVGGCSCVCGMYCIVKVKLEKNVFEADHGLITFRA